MATTTTQPKITKGGNFLLESAAAESIFTPADISDDQRLIGQTAEEFVTKEVLPRVKELEEKKPGLMVELVKKAGELGLLSAGVPEEYGGAGLDKISTTVLTEKISIYAGYAVTHGAQTGIGTLPIVYFGTEEQKKKYLPKLAGALNPLFKSTVRGTYKFAQKSKEMFAEAREQVHDVVAEVKAENETAANNGAASRPAA